MNGPCLQPQLYRRTRGQELPGNYNHVLLAELFHYQSRNWKPIASEHLTAVFDQVKLFVKDAVQHITTDENVSNEMLDRIHMYLEESRHKADQELERLWDDNSHQPITYNHYFTDNIQNARANATRNRIKQAMQNASIGVYNGKLHISNTTADAEKLLQALQRQVSVDIDDQACSEVLAGFAAYYKVRIYALAHTNAHRWQVARKTFVDNVCIQVVERHILRGLPKLFSPESVAAYTDDELQRIAGEGHERTMKRKQLQDLRENLVAAMSDLRR